jgi:hypothetical protein
MQGVHQRSEIPQGTKLKKDSGRISLRRKDFTHFKCQGDDISSGGSKISHHP